MQITLNNTNRQKLAAFCKKHSVKKWFLAKDDGAYFGATTGSDKDNTFENCIIYIKGCDPRKGDVWENTRRKFGGDDFGEHFDTGMLYAAEGGIQFNITPTKMEIRY